MQHLILMRHAKTETNSASGEDFDRDLTERGLKEAVTVAQALKVSGLKPDLALVSQAMRTRRTFEQISGVFEGIKADISEGLYNASAQTLRHFIEANEDRAQCLLVIAHNPGIQYLAGEYLEEGAAALGIIGRIRSSYPTAAATVFAVDVAGRPVYDGLYVPKDLLGA